MTRQVVLDVEKVNREVLQACLDELGADMAAKIQEAEKELSGLSLRFAKKSAETLKLFKADQATDIVAIMAAEGALIETRKVVLATFLAAPDAGLATAMQDRLIELTGAELVVAKKAAGGGGGLVTAHIPFTPGDVILCFRTKQPAQWTYRYDQATHMLSRSKRSEGVGLHAAWKAAEKAGKLLTPAVTGAALHVDRKLVDGIVWTELGDIGAQTSGSRLQLICQNVDEIGWELTTTHLSGTKSSKWQVYGGGDSLICSA